MKKILCLFIIILILLTFTGCSSTQVNANSEENASSFIVVEREIFNGYYYKVVYHKDTKVVYALSHYNVFTVMLDAEGKPLLWEGN